MLPSMSKCYTQYGLEHFTVGKFYRKKRKTIIELNDIMMKCLGMKFSMDQSLR